MRALANALETRPRAPRFPVHRHARRRQDHDRAHPREVAELRDGRERRSRAASAAPAARSTQGRFVDLLEVDAASRTKVDDTRELLDNVQYAPARGRYKVYLIDEVHMLSTHSFNALLKTLEEPPPHVKFLLATTDPQKLPVTVLSRCLQFNLQAAAAGADLRASDEICAGGEARSSKPAALRAGGARGRGQHARRAEPARPGDRLRRRPSSRPQTRA